MTEPKKSIRLSDIVKPRKKSARQLKAEGERFAKSMEALKFKPRTGIGAIIGPSHPSPKKRRKAR